MKTYLIYITAKDKEEARRIGRILVEERLAACANIIDGINSIYRWEGKIQDDSEALLIVKTREELVGRLTGKVKSIHSYSCPCVVALPITDGNKDFLKWIEGETG